MFVLSWRPGRGKILLAGIGALLLVGLAFWLPRWTDSGKSAMAEDAPFRVDAATDQERVDFLAQFGWEIDPEPLEIRELVIPQEFNDVYRNYNEVQKAQGMDLIPYAGKQCRRFTYRVTNYPDHPEGVHANLLVLDGKVIGGDICSVDLDGFLSSFDGRTQLESPAAGTESSASEQPPVVQEEDVLAEIPASAWPTD